MKLIDKAALVAEIERLINEIYAGRPFDSLSSEQQTALWYVKSIMSSVNTLEVKEMQEEPVSIWHDANEKPNVKEKSGIFVITSLNGEYIGSRYYNYNDITITFGNYDKWAYLNDLLNLSNVQRTVKDWKEPVSEELEEAANTYIDNWYKLNNLDKESYPIDVEISKNDFKAGAQWHKDKMMLNTIDATCFGFQGDALFSFRLPAGSYFVGSKVKVIVIKED